MNNKVYRIYLGCDLEEIERVLTALFERGFVFGAKYRIKSFDKLKEKYGKDFMEFWNYVVIGADEDCKMVLYYGTYTNNNGIITLEDFLKLK